MKSAPSTASFVANSVVCGAISITASSPMPIAYARRPAPVRGIVRGSVIMKNRKTRISGEKTSARQNSQPVIGPRCQRAVISWPLAASTASPPAKASQKPTAISSSFSRERIERPPTVMITSAKASATDIGPHQKSSGSACSGPSNRKQRTSPKFDGLKTCEPRNLITYFESSEIAAVPAKIHQPFMLHQSPCSVPGTRRMNATPFPVSSALAGHMSTRCVRNVIPISSTAQVSTETRIWAIERLKPNEVCPRTCSEMITAARCSRGSRTVGNSTGYAVPRMRITGRPASTAADAPIVRMLDLRSLRTYGGHDRREREPCRTSTCQKTSPGSGAR